MGPADGAPELHELRHPVDRVRPCRRHRRAPPAQAAAGARPLRPQPVRAAPRVGHRRRRHAHPDLARLPARPGRPGRAGADAALRLRVVRTQRRPWIRHPAAEPARPRHDLCDRACARRRRDGTALVRARQEAAQAEHVHRLHRLRAAPYRRRLLLPGSARRRRWQCGWAVDGRRREHGAAAVLWHPRGRAVRRRPHLDSRPVAAAHGDRMGRVGRPAARPGGVRLHEVLLAGGERAREALPAHPRRDEPQRHPGALRRAGEVGGQAARGGGGCPAQDRTEGRPRRRLRPLRRVASAGVRLRVDHRCRRRASVWRGLPRG